LALALLGLSGCYRRTGFRCLTDSECALGKDSGTCETSGYCSFHDSSCTSGRRYGAFADASSGQCVIVNDLGPAGQWAKLPDLPSPLGGMAAVVIGDQLLAHGGCTAGSQASGLILKYDLGQKTSGSWTTAQTTSLSRCLHAAVAIGGAMYLMGGTENAAQGAVMDNAVYRYDPDDGSFGVVAPTTSDVPTARFLHAAATDGRSMYIVAGTAQNGSDLNDAWRFDPVGSRGSWTRLPNILPGPNPSGVNRNGPVAAVSSGRLYVFGGYSPGPVIHGDAQELEDTWTIVNWAHPPGARAYGMMVRAGGSLLVFAGWNGAYLNDLHACSTDCTLLQPANPPSGRSEAAGATDGTHLFVVGGFLNDHMGTKEVWVYTP
jgi:non-specific serine/threonine protein kinase